LCVTGVQTCALPISFFMEHLQVVVGVSPFDVDAGASVPLLAVG
jgi:hypothetical protein